MRTVKQLRVQLTGVSETSGTIALKLGEQAEWLVLRSDYYFPGAEPRAAQAAI